LLTLLFPAAAVFLIYCRDSRAFPPLRKFPYLISFLSLLLLLAVLSADEDKAPLPAEMFVPNQQRWLSLRAKRSKSFGLCTSVNNVSVVA